jgi:hypothetical protein
MRCRILLVILSYLFMPLAPFPEGHTCSGQQGDLSRGQALAALRSKSSKPNSSFQIVREFTSTNEMQDFAQRAAEEASSRHVGVSEDGIFLALLRTGGFLILETDPATGSAISLNLISSGTDGDAIIESKQVEGDVSAVVAKELIENTADFVDALLDTPLSRVRGLESRFYGGRFPQYGSSEEQSLFAVPSTIRDLEVADSQAGELAALQGACNFWPIRYALSMPVYAASPDNAFRLALKKYESLISEFAQKNNKGPNLIYDLADLETVRTREQLRERISWFRRLDNFLEEAFQAEYVSSTFSVNKTISTVAIQMGTITTGKELTFAVMTSAGPGVIVGWKQLPDGTFAVTELGLGGD